MLFGPFSKSDGNELWTIVICCHKDTSPGSTPFVNRKIKGGV
jgi:hypothetical protein